MVGTDIYAYLLIDDSTPEDQPPFAHDPSYWDLRNDLGLSGSHDYRFYAAIAGVRNDSGVEPLFPPRAPHLSNAGGLTGRSSRNSTMN